MEDAGRGRILVIDDDRDIAEIVTALLTDEGYDVSGAFSVEPGAVIEVVGRLEPDCVLLDSTGPVDYGASWALAARLRVRRRRVPTIMFTAHGQATREAAENVSERSREAGFSAVIAKPFDMEELLAAIRQAVGESVPFDRSPPAEAHRTGELVERLRQGGAQDIRPSWRREWATFRSPGGHLVQLYWWQERGVYLVGRYSEDGSTMETVGQCPDRDEAIALALRT